MKNLLLFSLYIFTALISSYLFVEWLLVYYILGSLIVPILLRLRIKEGYKNVPRIIVVCYCLGIIIGIIYKGL